MDNKNANANQGNQGGTGTLHKNQVTNDISNRVREDLHRGYQFYSSDKMEPLLQEQSIISELEKNGKVLWSPFSKNESMR